MIWLTLALYVLGSVPTALAITVADEKGRFPLPLILAFAVLWPITTILWIVDMARILWRRQFTWTSATETKL